MSPPFPVFCTIIPPHVLDHLSRSADPRLSGAARRTLDGDHHRRQFRREAALATAPSASSAPASAATAQRTIHDAEHGTLLPGPVVRREGEEPGQDASVNRAYNGLGATYELFQKVYARDSIDGRGLPLHASVHYDREYNNAFWDGQQMVFGDGDGEVFLDFTLPVDVIGHELTHGVTQYTANLEYSGQSGALNESISDVFGSLIKQYAKGQRAEDADWLIGDGLFTSRVQGVALRSMKAPGTAYDDDVLGKDPQPGSMDDYVDTQEDNGGVHINSGIPNHAFYLFATGLGGFAWERAGRVWFDVLTGGELSAHADFAEFARLTSAAADGKDEREALAKAWSEVGVALS